ncbi:kinase suppressor of Ras 2-like isoform X2 [Tubulanus polymorphus]|uniref:kinase suppressor of Ras 2-like isoform X2 n=1 Tax=Tubulanus polymorphus TaxID=672921 RepID=UPI003DA68EFA
MAKTERDCEMVKKAVDTCCMIQSMIDFTARHLDGLRTICATSIEITQQEIRETEGKLIKLFSKQLASKAKLMLDEVPSQLQDYPNTDQWLKIVGIEERVISDVKLRDVTLECLLDMSEDEVAEILLRYDGIHDSQIKQLNTALKKLRICTERQLKGERISGDDLELYWTSYKLNSPFGTSPKILPRPSTSSLPPETFFAKNSSSPPSTPPAAPPQSTPSSPAPHLPHHRRNGTPPPTPPVIRSKKAPATPPPKNKIRLHPDGYPLQKSRSHESQLFNRIQDTDSSKHKHKPHNLKLTGSYEALSKRRPSTGDDISKSGHSSTTSSPKKFDYNNSDDRSNSLPIPKSPKTPVGPCATMSHVIQHRFASTFKITTCDYCQKQMFLGFKCKECKYKCHRECAVKVAPACGLPDKLVDIFMDVMHSGSPNSNRKISTSSMSNQPTQTHIDFQPGLKAASSVPAFQGQDSSSTASSCNSSTPSSPALIPGYHAHIGYPSPQPSPQISVSQFNFPDVIDSFNYGKPDITEQDLEIDDEKRDVINTNTSNDSDKTVVDSIGSSGSSGDTNKSLQTVESIDNPDDQQSWHRQNSISVTLKEWDIPYTELEKGDILGTGRFGTVHKGNWHGDVAIKLLNIDNEIEIDAQLSAFKLEVAMLRKTRHENLVLFMGACMKPPDLAIVTSLCKGQTLYTHIHMRREKFQMNRTVIISSQIAQGMGYLHAKGIIHKDIKTKNIFLEAGKVVITDFGLFNVTKLCHGTRKGDWLSISPGWLCYLAPEIIQVLHAGENSSRSDLNFTEYSDVYAFGTVWYELLSGDWPFKNLPPESIIWQVGKGMKQSLMHVTASRDVKDILMACWAFKCNNRPDFAQILKALEKLPKKRLNRSPSHPVQLSRSAESVF